MCHIRRTTDKYFPYSSVLDYTVTVKLITISNEQLVMQSDGDSLCGDEQL